MELGSAAVRLSPEGRVTLTAGWLQHKVKANWKMLLENETDGYHPQFVHASIFSVADSGIGNLYGERSLAVSRDLGGGHTENDLRPEFRRIGQPQDRPDLVAADVQNLTLGLVLFYFGSR